MVDIVIRVKVPLKLKEDDYPLSEQVALQTNSRCLGNSANKFRSSKNNASQAFCVPFCNKCICYTVHIKRMLVKGASEESMSLWCVDISRHIHIPTIVMLEVSC